MVVLKAIIGLQPYLLLLMRSWVYLIIQKCQSTNLSMQATKIPNWSVFRPLYLCFRSVRTEKYPTDQLVHMAHHPSSWWSAQLYSKLPQSTSFQFNMYDIHLRAIAWCDGIGLGCPVWKRGFESGEQPFQARLGMYSVHPSQHPAIRGLALNTFSLFIKRNK